MNKINLKIIILAMLLSMANSALALTDILQQCQGLKPEVLKLALAANQVLQQNGKNSQQIITIVDYSRPSNQNRLWVIDLKRKKVLFETLVAHGKGSGQLYATQFSNQLGSKQSSIGVFLTGQTYCGHHGLSLDLHGLEPGINDQANKRHIVMHSAPYVSQEFIQQHGATGRSWGCPALNPKIIDSVIHTIKNGTLFFAYYPDHPWLEHSCYLQTHPSTTELAPTFNPSSLLTAI